MRMASLAGYCIVTDILRIFTNIFLCLFSLRFFTERCTLPPSVCSGKIRSYVVMQILVGFVHFGSYILVQLMLPLYRDISYNELVNPYKWFCWCRKILIYLVGSSICNQLASILTCRSIEILYDIRYISMFILQIIGFFICLSFAFFLGVKYASVRCRN